MEFFAKMRAKYPSRFQKPTLRGLAYVTIVDFGWTLPAAIIWAIYNLRWASDSFIFKVQVMSVFVSVVCLLLGFFAIEALVWTLRWRSTKK